MGSGGVGRFVERSDFEEEGGERGTRFGSGLLIVFFCLDDDLLSSRTRRTNRNEPETVI